MILANTLSSSLTYATMPFKIIALVTISSSLPPMSWFVNTDFYWNFVLLTYYCIDTLLFYCFKCISFHRFVANCYHMSCLWLLTLHVIPIGAVSIAFLPRIICSGPFTLFSNGRGDDAASRDCVTGPCYNRCDQKHNHCDAHQLLYKKGLWKETS